MFTLTEGNKDCYYCPSPVELTSYHHENDEVKLVLERDNAHEPVTFSVTESGESARGSDLPRPSCDSNSYVNPSDGPNAPVKTGTKRAPEQENDSDSKHARESGSSEVSSHYQSLPAYYDLTLTNCGVLFNFNNSNSNNSNSNNSNSNNSNSNNSNSNNSNNVQATPVSPDRDEGVELAAQTDTATKLTLPRGSRVILSLYSSDSDTVSESSSGVSLIGYTDT